MLLKDTDLIKEWDWERNEKIGLYGDSIKTGSNHYAFWICQKCGYKWNTKINNRFYSKSGCPLCSGRDVLTGFNDLQTQYPEIAKEWDYDRNDFLPSEVKPHTAIKVNWICKRCGKKYKSTISNRTSINNSINCPVCKREKQWETKVQNIINKKGSLETNYPNIAKHWDYKKNNINPNVIAPHSGKSYFWICENCGITFSQTPHIMVRNESCLCKECRMKVSSSKKKAASK